jgi:maleylacetoacetate isomerase
MMRLFGFWRSMAAYRVRVALNLKGIAVEEIPIDLDGGEQLRPEYLAINPQGAVPALIEPGMPPLVQSMAILEYLEECYPVPSLLPRDPRGRARVRALAAVVASDTHPLFVPRVSTYLTTRGGFDAAAMRDWRITWIRRALSIIEAHLAGDPATGEFCHGGSVTFADICLASLGTVAKTFKFEITNVPTVTRILDRCEQLDAFARAHPSRQLGAPLASG